LEQWAVLLPWSFFLTAFFSRNFRHQLRPFSASLQFCAGAVAVTIFSVWFPPEAKTRYYLPMVPCFVILAAVVVEQCRLQMKEGAEKKKWWSKLWTLFLNTSIAVLPLIGIGYGILSMGTCFSVPVRFLSSLILFAAAVLVCVILICFRRKTTQIGFTVCGASLVLFIAAAYNLLYVDTLKEKYENVEIHVERILRNLPETKLYSIKPVPYQFVYYYMLHTGKALPVMTQNQNLQAGQYFCILEDDFSQWNPEQVKIIARIRCNRFKSEFSREPSHNVLIGIRL
jgi:hypothetical protein